MDITTEKIGCAFQFPEAECKGMAHVFTHRYAGREFWYGVAQLTDAPPSNPPSVQVVFDDGRVGYASICDGKLSGDYTEVGFIGLARLVPSK
jgi:hypothetical protein